MRRRGGGRKDGEVKDDWEGYVRGEMGMEWKGEGIIHILILMSYESVGCIFVVERELAVPTWCTYCGS